jgi:hypothetical protein
MLTLETAAMTVVVDPARGAELRRIAGADGHNVLADYTWQTPVPATRSAGYGSSMLDWLSAYRGGWQELFPNSGPECVADGVPLPFHGEASVSAWDVVACDGRGATLRVGARLPLTLERRMRLDAGAPVLRIEERAVNVGETPVAFAWGHHPAFVARAGMRVDLPVGPVWIEPEADGPPAGCWPRLTATGEDLAEIDGRPVERLLYLPQRPAGWAALREPARGGVALAWDLATFPHLWLWQEIGGTGFPFHGRACSVAIEPQSGWPMGGGLAGARERGRCLTLAPGAARETWLTVALLPSGDRPVRAVAREGTVTLASD